MQLLFAAGRAAVVRAAVARHRLGDHAQGRIVRVERVLDGALVERQRQRRHRIRLAARRAEFLVVRPPHAQRRFRSAVVALQVVVLDRPVARDAVDAAQLEIVRQEAPRGGRPMPRRAAHRADVLRVELVLALEDQVVVVRPVLRVRRPGRGRIRRHEIHLVGLVAEALDDLPARQTGPGLQHQHRLARARQLVRHQRAGHAGTHHHDIGLLGLSGLGHQLCFSTGGSAQKPGRLGQYVRITRMSDTTPYISACS